MLALRSPSSAAVTRSPLAQSSFQLDRFVSAASAPDPTSSTALARDLAAPRVAYKPKRLADGEYARLARQALAARFVKVRLRQKDEIRVERYAPG